MSFVVPSAFLGLRVRGTLQGRVLDGARVVRLTLFPSSFFPKIGFNCTGLSVVALEGEDSCGRYLGGAFAIIGKFGSIRRLGGVSSRRLGVCSFARRRILGGPSRTFLVTRGDGILELVGRSGFGIKSVTSYIAKFCSNSSGQFLRIVDPRLGGKGGCSLMGIRDVGESCGGGTRVLGKVRGRRRFLPVMGNKGAGCLGPRD